MTTLGPTTAKSSSIWHGEPCATDPDAYLDDVARTGDESGARLARRLAAYRRGEWRPNELPSVTVAIPCYNSRDCVVRAVDSVLAQRWLAVEIVVVDDGSTDGSGEMVRERYGDRVRVVRKENGGLSSARNAGLDAATGDFLHWLDADDELRPYCLSDKIRAFAECPDADVCYSHYTLESDDGWPILPEDLYQVPVRDPLSAVGDPMIGATVIYPFQASTVMAKTCYLRRHGRFEKPMRMGEDIRCWFGMARAGLKAIALTEPATHRYCRPGSLTQNRAGLHRYNLLADDMNLREIIGEPASARYVVGQVVRMSRLWAESVRLGMAVEEAEQWHGRLDAIDAEIASGPLPRPIAAMLLDQVLIAMRSLARELTDVAASARLRDRIAKLKDMIDELPSPSKDDWLTWMPAVARGIPFRERGLWERSAIHYPLGQAHLALLHARKPPSVAALNALSVAFPGHAYASFWKAASKLASAIGERGARIAVSNWWVQKGWAAAGAMRRWKAPRPAL